MLVLKKVKMLYTNKTQNKTTKNEIGDILWILSDLDDFSKDKQARRINKEKPPTKDSFHISIIKCFFKTRTSNISIDQEYFFISPSVS